MLTRELLKITMTCYISQFWQNKKSIFRIIALAAIFIFIMAQIEFSWAEGSSSNFLANSWGQHNQNRITQSSAGHWFSPTKATTQTPGLFLTNNSQTQSIASPEVNLNESVKTNKSVPQAVDFPNTNKDFQSITPSSFTTAYNSSNSSFPELGDVAGNQGDSPTPDGKITVGDALVTLKFALGLEEPTEAQKLSANVVNPSDEEINVGDALVILRESLGLITPEEKETRVDTSIDILNQPEVSFREEYWGVSMLNKYADDSDIGITQKGEMVTPLLNEYETTDNSAFRTVSGDSLVKVGRSVFCDTCNNGNVSEMSADILTSISAAEPGLGANIATEIATQPEFGLEGANSFFLTLRDNDGQAFSRTFGELCDSDVTLAADSFNSNFGIAEPNISDPTKPNDKTPTMYILLPQAGMTSQQLNRLLSTRGEGGEYLLPDEKTVEFFVGWTRQMGGESPWDEAIIPFVNSGRGEELLEPLVAGYESLNSSISIPVEEWMSKPMEEQLFLSLVDVIQEDGTPEASEILNKGIEKEIFELDPEVDLSIMREEEEWKMIASNPSTTEFTRAAALSQIEDEEWLKAYVFDTDKDEGLSFDRDISDVEFAAIIRTGQTSSWYDQLTDEEEKIYYFQRILAADTTDLKQYFNSSEKLNMVFDCSNFSVQLHMNGIGFDEHFVGEPEEFEYHGYTIPQNPYGLPIAMVALYTESMAHAINALFIGNNSDSLKELTNTDNWIFAEPQLDTNGSYQALSKGSWVPEEGITYVYLYLDQLIFPEELVVSLVLLGMPIIK